MKGPDILINNRVNNELVNQLYLRFNTILNAEILGTILFIALLWDGVDHRYLFTWLGYNIVIACYVRVVAFIYYRYKKNQQLGDINFWNKLFTLSVFLEGTVWALAGMLFLVVNDQLYNFIIILVLIIVAGAANAELFHNKTGYLVFVFPIYLSILTVLLSVNDNLYTALFIGMVVYMSFTTILAVKSSEALQNALFLRFKHKELLEYLSNAHHDLEAANKKLQNKIQVRHKAEKLLLELATHDYLTKLPNRNLFRSMLEQSFALAERSKTMVALFFIDLDKFKLVNDTYGHDMGDKVLIELAQRLQSSVRNIDMIVRFGGDEFCIVFDDLRSVDQIKVIASKMCTDIAKPFEIEGKQISMSASIGVGIYPNDSGDFDSLFKIADIALYWAKKAGRNTYKVFEDE